MVLLILGAAAAAARAARPGAQEQLERGRRLYSFYCASCHGPVGEGGYGVPPLAGLRRGYPCRFPDAQRLYAWVSRNMPPEDVLRPQDYWDILATLLRGNRELPQGTPLTPENAPRIGLRAFCPRNR